MASATRTLKLRDIRSRAQSNLTGRCQRQNLDPCNLALEGLPLTIAKDLAQCFDIQLDIKDLCVSTPESIMHHPISTQGSCIWSEWPLQWLTKFPQSEVLLPLSQPQAEVLMTMDPPWPLRVLSGKVYFLPPPVLF